MNDYDLFMKSPKGKTLGNVWAETGKKIII